MGVQMSRPFNYDPNDDDPPFLLPGELEGAMAEARFKMSGRKRRTLQEEIEEAMKKPPIPQVEDKPKI
jgi:hypothetical protein